MGDYMAKIRGASVDDFDLNMRGGTDDEIFALINRESEKRAAIRREMEQTPPPRKKISKKFVLSWILRYVGCLACVPCAADFAARGEILLTVLSTFAFFGAFASLVIDADKAKE